MQPLRQREVRAVVTKSALILFKFCQSPRNDKFRMPLCHPTKSYSFEGLWLKSKSVNYSLITHTQANHVQTENTSLTYGFRINSTT